ncbi:epimerase [Erythrobacter sp. QSSC1-22B]|uniref:NAD-dependent epimerase/dehydratase family protein n=1 Tax=Erythrobacter sp. QSSC1-22B TaxID=1860125 RepID=UPI000804C8C3|nr:NAD(P)-dependent oxidoreductase [Erythrobacter sp. QSSC1-22B]OBX19070.1 epimerase [Erythrobacter sp. QSSC1-22B]
MTLAVTGATGFVGRALLDAAECGSASLRALARQPQAPREGVEWIAGDLADETALAKLVAGADAVVHIAGLTNSTDPSAFGPANVDGTARLIDAMKAARAKRLVFVSSLAAREPCLSAYGASKAEAEAIVEGSGLDWTIVRPPGVYGPRDVDYLEMFRSARFGFVPLPPRGASSIIHVADLARLLLALVDAPLALVRNRVFEPDDGREGGWSHAELAKAIGGAIGRRVWAPNLPRPLLDLAARADRLIRGSRARLTADRVGYMVHPNWVARSSKNVPEAVWRPSIDGEAGLRQTAEWYRREGWL